MNCDDLPGRTCRCGSKRARAANLGYGGRLSCKLMASHVARRRLWTNLSPKRVHNSMGSWFCRTESSSEEILPLGQILCRSRGNMSTQTQQGRAPEALRRKPSCLTPLLPDTAPHYDGPLSCKRVASHAARRWLWTNLSPKRSS